MNDKMIKELKLTLNCEQIKGATHPPHAHTRIKFQIFWWKIAEWM